MRLLKLLTEINTRYPELKFSMLSNNREAHLTLDRHFVGSIYMSNICGEVTYRVMKNVKMGDHYILVKCIAFDDYELAAIIDYLISELST